MNQREDYEEAKKFCQRLYQESGQAHHRLHPREQVRSRPDHPFAWHDEGSERVDPETGWKWYDTQQTPSSSSGWQPSAAWWQSSSRSQTSKWGELFFLGEKQGISLTGSGDSLVSDEECEHHTQPTRRSTRIWHFHTRDCFSYASRLKTTRSVVSLGKHFIFTSQHSMSYALCLVYPVDRYTSHESFSRTLSPCAHTTLWLKVSQRAHSLHPHAIHDVTCLSVRWLFLVLFSSSLSRLYLFSIVYLFSALHINFHNAEPAED